MVDRKALLLLALAFLGGILAHRTLSSEGKVARLKSAVSGRATHRLPDEGKKIHIESETERLGALRSLGYVTASFDPDSSKRGVVEHDAERAFKGYTLYDSVLRGRAYLLDMDGRPVHRWRYDIEPVSHVHVELLGNGDLLVQVYEQELLRINQRSEVLWRFPARVHHDLAIGPGNDIFLLTRREIDDPRFHSVRPSLEDTVTRLSADGEVKEVISLLAMVRNSPYSFLLPSVNQLSFAPTEGGLDLLHTNHIHYLDHTGIVLPQVFSEGRFMVSMRNISTIAVFDWSEQRLVWAWGPTNISFQHHSTLLDNGNVLLFDNGRTKSRVIEIEPEQHQIRWDYAPESGFFSKTRGGAQRLPNGNTLITESDKGYAFEVTEQGEVVWKFANPEVNSRGERGIIWRMKRFAPEELPFLSQANSD